MPDQATLDMMELERKAESLRRERAERRRRQAEVRDRYLELTMAVKRPVLGESRHDTALRYIQEAESPPKDLLGKAKALVTRLEH